MHDITVSKDEFLAKVQANRDAHRAAFEEALEAYRDVAIERLNEHIDRIKSGSVERVYVVLPQPTDHTDDYDRIISMIEMNVHDHVHLSEGDFDRYVRDNWAWKQEFLTTNDSYTSIANARG